MGCAQHVLYTLCGEPQWYVYAVGILALTGLLTIIESVRRTVSHRPGPGGGVPKTARPALPNRL